MAHFLLPSVCTYYFSPLHYANTSQLMHKKYLNRTYKSLRLQTYKGIKRIKKITEEKTARDRIKYHRPLKEQNSSDIHTDGDTETVLPDNVEGKSCYRSHVSPEDTATAVSCLQYRACLPKYYRMRPREGRR